MISFNKQGAAFGKVLMGVQVPHNERKAIKKCFDELGFQWREETHNPAYQYFAGGSESE